MADEKYFRRIIAKGLGVKEKDLTLDMVNEYCDRMEEKATTSTSETLREMGRMSRFGERRFMPYEEELKLRNFIHHWNK